jgi:hypothetical protein
LDYQISDKAWKGMGYFSIFFADAHLYVTNRSDPGPAGVKYNGLKCLC